MTLINNLIDKYTEFNNDLFWWTKKRKDKIKSIFRRLEIGLDIGIKLSFLAFVLMILFKTIPYIHYNNFQELLVIILVLDLFITYGYHIIGYFKK